MGFRRQRRRIADEATGRVLEVAAGTGLTFPFYTCAQEVIAIDPDPAMLKRARHRAANAPGPVQLLQADAESLPFADAAFDTIVIAFGLCTIPHPENALREARRVLKPDGQLLFLEHVRSTGWRHARLQDLAAPAWRRLTGGCHPNRPSLEDKDLRILDVTIQVKLRLFPRMRSCKREWKRAHISGAAFTDLQPGTPRHGRSRCPMRSCSRRTWGGSASATARGSWSTARARARGPHGCGGCCGPRGCGGCCAHSISTTPRC